MHNSLHHTFFLLASTSDRKNSRTVEFYTHWC